MKFLLFLSKKKVYIYGLGEHIFFCKSILLSTGHIPEADKKKFVQTILTLCICALSWNLQFVDHSTAHTTVRLWHQLHKEKKIAHDFSDMLAPDSNSVHAAIIHAYEIKAIARCKRFDVDTIELQQIAHPPDEIMYSLEMIGFMYSQDINMTVNMQSLKKQPRVYCQELFRLSKSI